MTTLRTRELRVEVAGDRVTLEIAGRRVTRVELEGEQLVIETAGRPSSASADGPAPPDGTDSGLGPVTHLGVIVRHNGFAVWTVEEPHHA